MECRMQKETLIAASMCDHTAKLGVPNIFTLFQDLASEHGTAMKLGADDLAPKGMFWLTVKTKVRIHERPKMMQKVTAETWPEEPGKIRCHRYYLLSDGEKALAEGKSEWAVMEIATGRIVRAAEVYPDGLEHSTQVVCGEPFARIPDKFAEDEEIAVYTVRSTDIDLGQHMNNAAYVHTLFGALSTKEWDALDLREVEVHFRTPCFEGDRLSIRRRKTENGFEMGILREDGKTAVAARFTCGQA